MKSKKHPYKQIVSNQIKNIDFQHPLENQKDKTYFINLLTTDLGVSSFCDISKQKSNLFQIVFNNLFYNIYVEFVDGGGRDISQNDTSKKVSIPFHVKSFQRIIKNFNRVAVVDIYIPLKENKDLDLENRVYLIIKCDEIYTSKVLEKGTWNPSSRWVKLETILDVIKDKQTKLNEKGNVYIVHWTKLKYFFETTFNNEYSTMINNQLSSISLNEIQTSKKYNKYRKIFREKLLLTKQQKCEILNCQIDILELLVASHIKPVNEIKNDNKLTEQEKIQQIQDENNGLLLCPNHDKLFDKFLISFEQNGFLKVKSKYANKMSHFNLTLEKEIIKIMNEKTKEYLKVHNQLFEKEN